MTTAIAPAGAVHKAVPTTAVFTSYTYHLCTYVMDVISTSTKHWYICLEHSWQLYTNVWATPLWLYISGFSFQTAINRTTSLPVPSSGAITNDGTPGEASAWFRLLELPDELLVAVLAHLPTSERARCALVCHRMASVLSTTPAWRSISICTSRWSTLKETKIDTWLTQRTGIRTVHHLQLGSPQYRVRLQRTSLINHIHGLLNGLQRVDVQHVEPFAAGRLLMGAPGLIHANLTGAACNDPELRTLTAADVRCHQLTSLTLHAPDGVVMPSWPMFLSTLQHLAFISLAAPGAHWQVPDDDISTLQRLSSLHLHGMDMVALPSTLTTLTALTEMRLLRVKRVEGLVHVPNGLHVLHTDGVRWLGGLAALVGRLHELRVLRVSASGRAEMLPQVLMQLCKLEVLCLREDAAEHHGDDIPLMDGDEVPHDGEHHHHHEGQQHVLSLSLDTLAPLKALREVELSGSGRELHVEGQQLAVLAGLPHLTRFEVRCSCMHSVHGSVEVMRALQDAFAQAKPSAHVASLQFRSASCASLSHLVGDGDGMDGLDG